MPKVSIILPCYNVEKYIAKSIESVLSQTFQNFELLIINDGTPDNSMEIARGYKDPRIKIFDKENGGLSDARNYGIERAQGEYIYFMDSDDWIEPTLLADNLPIIESEDLDFIVFGYIQDDADKDGNLIQSTSVTPPNKIYNKANRDLLIDTHLLGLLGYAWNKIYKKSFLNEHSLRFEKGTSLIEDILFNTQVYINSDKLRFVDKAYYHYSNRPEVTLIKQFHKNSFELKLRRIKALTAFFDEWEVDNKDEILGSSLVGGIRYCIHNLFSFKNELRLKDKVDYINNMLTHPDTIRLIEYYKPNSRKDSIYKAFIKNKMAYSIALMALIIK